MLTRKMVLGILFILGISLLNAAVLIEASNQESQLFVDPADPQPMLATSGTYTFRRCNSTVGKCNIIDNNYDCTETSSGCSDTQR